MDVLIQAIPATDGGTSERRLRRLIVEFDIFLTLCNSGCYEKTIVAQGSS